MKTLIELKITHTHNQPRRRRCFGDVNETNQQNQPSIKSLFLTTTAVFEEDDEFFFISG